MTTIGIDLGTSAAVVAALVDGQPSVLVNQEGSRITPAIVARTPDGQWVAGQPAKRLAILYPDRAVWDFVRILGRRLDSPEARNLATLVPFELVEGAGGRACLRLGGEDVDPTVLVGILLAKLKAAAEAALSSLVEGAVIGVPAQFDAHQRALVREAASMAGLEVRSLATSTSLAGLVYVPASEDAPERVGIVDVGGGGFTISILERGRRHTRVLATEWEPFVGGEDFDQLLVGAFVEDLRRDEGVDAASDPIVLARLKEVAEKAKCRLSVLDRVEVELPLGASRLWSVTRERSTLEALVAPQLQWLAAPSARALRASGTRPGELQAVLNVGGSTRMPLVLETLRDSFGQDITPALHPDESAAMGAAVLGGIPSGSIEGASYRDVLHRSVGVEAPPRRFAPIAERGAPLPLEQSRLFTTTDSRLELTILEGDDEDVRKDLFLGKLLYEVPFRKGATQVKVIVEVDAGGEIRVSSLDVKSGILRKVPLRHAAGLGEKERERARREVERYRERLLVERADRVPPKRRRSQRSKTAVEEARAIAAKEVDGEVLREIGADPRWSGDYAVARALVANPRTPAEVSLGLVDALEPADLEALAADESLPAVVREQCAAVRKLRG